MHSIAVIIPMNALFRSQAYSLFNRYWHRCRHHIECIRKTKTTESISWIRVAWKQEFISSDFEIITTAWHLPFRLLSVNRAEWRKKQDSTVALYFYSRFSNFYIFHADYNVIVPNKNNTNDDDDYYVWLCKPLLIVVFVDEINEDMQWWLKLLVSLPAICTSIFII